LLRARFVAWATVFGLGMVFLVMIVVPHYSSSSSKTLHPPPSYSEEEEKEAYEYSNGPFESRWRWKTGLYDVYSKIFGKAKDESNVEPNLRDDPQDIEKKPPFAEAGDESAKYAEFKHLIKSLIYRRIFKNVYNLLVIGEFDIPLKNAAWESVEESERHKIHKTTIKMKEIMRLKLEKMLFSHLPHFFDPCKVGLCDFFEGGDSETSQYEQGDIKEEDENFVYEEMVGKKGFLKKDDMESKIWTDISEWIRSECVDALIQITVNNYDFNCCCNKEHNGRELFCGETRRFGNIKPAQNSILKKRNLLEEIYDDGEDDGNKKLEHRLNALNVTDSLKSWEKYISKTFSEKKRSFPTANPATNRKSSPTAESARYPECFIVEPEEDGGSNLVYLDVRVKEQLLKSHPSPNVPQKGSTKTNRKQSSIPFSSENAPFNVSQCKINFIVQKQ
jgi:hypothetical protein